MQQGSYAEEGSCQCPVCSALGIYAQQGNLPLASSIKWRSCVEEGFRIKARSAPESLQVHAKRDRAESCRLRSCIKHNTKGETIPGFSAPSERRDVHAVTKLHQESVAG
jgi:hypothetical protein